MPVWIGVRQMHGFPMTVFSVIVARHGQHKRQAQARQVGMPGPDLRLDGRDLLASVRDSYCILLAFLSDLVEAPAVAVQRNRIFWRSEE